MEIYNLATKQVLSESAFRALHENISFPATLSAETLAEYECVAVLASPQPACTEYQSVARDGVVKDGKGNYVQAWKIVNFTQQQIDAYDAAKAVQDAKNVADKIDQLWNAANNYVSQYISGLAVGLLTIGLLQQKPKALAVSTWSSHVWDEYYTRKAAVTAASNVNLDFSSFGPMPYSVPELRVELGM